MGVVIAAHHVQLDERCALKFLLPSALGDANSVARFVREARAAVKIKSEHVARVTDVGTLENGLPYMVMEYLDGEDLDAWLRKRGALSVELAVDFILQACEAIADAHALGIVHRDLKPANLFCIARSDGGLSIKVLDFGISKLMSGTGESSQNMTRTSAFLGSPLYMSPEQMKSSKDIDARTDQWSIGVILFELLTGKLPYMADSPTELIFKVASETAPPIRSVRPDIPVALEQIIATLLQRTPAQRFPSVAELAVALGPFAPPRARASVDRVVGTLRRSRGGPSFTSSADGFLGAAPSIANAATAAIMSGAAGPPPPANVATAASWGQTGGGRTGDAKSSSTSGKLVAVVVALGVVFAGLVVGAAQLRGSRAAVTASASTDRSASPVSAAPPLPPAAAAAAPLPSAAPAPPPPPPPPIVSIAPVAPSPIAASPTPPRPPTLPTPPVRPVQPGPTKTNCNPPYVIDSAGDRQYKPECL